VSYSRNTLSDHLKAVDRESGWHPMLQRIARISVRAAELRDNRGQAVTLGTIARKLSPLTHADARFSPNVTARLLREGVVPHPSVNKSLTLSSSARSGYFSDSPIRTDALSNLLLQLVSRAKLPTSSLPSTGRSTNGDASRVVRQAGSRFTRAGAVESEPSRESGSARTLGRDNQSGSSHWATRNNYGDTFARAIAAMRIASGNIAGQGAGGVAEHREDRRRSPHGTQRRRIALDQTSMRATRRRNAASLGAYADRSAGIAGPLGRYPGTVRQWSRLVSSLGAFRKVSSPPASLTAHNAASENARDHAYLWSKLSARNGGNNLEGRPTGSPTFITTPAGYTATANPMSAPKTRSPRNTPAPSVLVTYSPTLILQGSSNPPEIERHLLDVMGRHGYELANILEREYARRGRTAL
jgi:hypothetical protein